MHHTKSSPSREQKRMHGPLTSSSRAPPLLRDPPHSRNRRIRPHRALLLCNDPPFMRAITSLAVGGEQSRGAEKSMHAPRARGKVPRVCRRQSCHHDHGGSSSSPATFFKFFPSYQRHTFLNEGARNTKRTRRRLIEDPAKFGLLRQRRLPASREQAGVLSSCADRWIQQRGRAWEPGWRYVRKLRAACHPEQAARR
jgi:hypothetical protein